MVEAGRRDVYPGRRLVLKRTLCLLPTENQGLVLLRFNTWLFIAESFAIIPIHGTILTILTEILYLSLVWGVNINMEREYGSGQMNLVGRVDSKFKSIILTRHMFYKL